jgi:hypothetical protein
MDTIQELRRVIEMHLYYTGGAEKSKDGDVSSLSAVRGEISKYKSYLRIFTPLSTVLSSLVLIAAVLSILGATWIPWAYMGILVVASFVAIFITVQNTQKLEQVKKRELFLFILYKMNRA